MTEQPREFVIPTTGAFSLAESAAFGFGQRQSSAFAGVMRLAFVLDRSFDPVGVEVRQNGLDVHCRVFGKGDLDAVRRQVSRVLSLDHDGRAFDQVGRRDRIIGQLQDVAPGLRPPLFYSPYEAAAWAIISIRRPARQAAELRSRLSQVHGTEFDLAGERVVALPNPEQLLAVSDFPGLPAEQLTRLHAVARTTLDGAIDADVLLAQGPDRAVETLRKIKGIGPFYSNLIVVRGTGFVDVFPREEPLLLELMTRLYRLSSRPSAAELERITDNWRPFRTWTSVLVRAASSRLAAAA
jgi:DNA-3-methyladenine glycosylase II